MKYILPLVILGYFDGTAQRDCDLKLNKDSIKVYTCKVADSKFRSVKTVFELNGTLSHLAGVIMNLDSYKDWQYKTISATLQKKVNEREIIYYTEVESPSLTSNRDFVIRLTVDQNPKTRELYIEAVSIPNYIPPVKDVIRVPFSKAYWKVRPLSAHKLSVEYYIEIDLGGAVPPWMVNLVAHQAPYETFKNLRHVIGKYKGSKASFVKD